LNPLLDNAIKYSPKGGEVRVSVTTTGDSIRVAISDNGPGIPAAEFEHLLPSLLGQQDQELGQRMRGSGLGLDMARRFIKLHGGTLWIERPRSRNGTTVVFDLPSWRQSPR